MLRGLVVGIVGIIAVASVGPMLAQAPPAPAPPAPAPFRPTPLQAARKAGEFLRKQYAPPNSYTGTHGLGETSLAGLAMLEAGVPPSDPAIQRIANEVRAGAAAEVNTYRVALCILFLDRLGIAADIPWIQYLGVRIYAAMNAMGGWSYNCVPPGTPTPNASALQAALSTRPEPGQLHPLATAYLQATRQVIATTGRSGAGDDNSNTQFALIALWVATRHGLPVNDAFLVIEQRFFRTQNRSDGGWSYSISDLKSTASMTCAGLLGLAAGASKRESILTGRKEFNTPAPAPEASKKPNDAFANPRGIPKPDGAADAPPEPAAIAPGVRSLAVRAGLTALGRLLAATPNPNGTPGPGILSSFVSHGDWYYMLWSVERVGVIFDLQTIGDVDWYDWGCSYILPAQAEDGSFTGGTYGASIDTSFAILFLCKTNLVRDMRMQERVKDPGRAELRAGSAPGLYAPRQAEPVNPLLRSPSAAPPAAPVGLEVALPAVQDTSEAARFADAMLAVKGNDEAFTDRLIENRDSQGVMRTLALARVIPQLDGALRKQTRDALTQRMTRMTAPTLAGYMRDPDPELRRAAALAAGMRSDEKLLADLIDRIHDPSESVVRAARAALTKISGKDMGPTIIEPSAQATATEAWRRWAATRPKP
jgi:hypothetical protein